METSDNPTGCTEEEHRAYLGTVRAKVKELNDLIDAAPCTETLARAVQMALLLVEHFGRELEAEAAMQRLREARQEKVKRAYGLS